MNWCRRSTFQREVWKITTLQVANADEIFILMLHDFIEQSHITFLLSLRIFRVELSLIRVHPSLEFSRIQTLALDYEADMPIENRNQRIHQIISLCLTIFTFAFSLLASLVSIAVIISMICHCFRNTKSLHEKTALMLSFHIYLLMGSAS